MNVFAENEEPAHLDSCTEGCTGCECACHQVNPASDDPAEPESPADNCPNCDNAECTGCDGTVTVSNEEEKVLTCTGNKETCPIENCECKKESAPTCTGNKDTCPIENCECKKESAPTCTGNKDTCPIENCTCKQEPKVLCETCKTTETNEDGTTKHIEGCETLKPKILCDKCNSTETNEDGTVKHAETCETLCTCTPIDGVHQGECIFAPVVEKTGPQVGDTIYIKSGEKTYKKPDLSSKNRVVWFYYQTEIVAIVTDDNGEVWYEFKPTGLLEWFKDYKYVHVDSTTTIDPEQPEPEVDDNGIPVCDCEGEHTEECVRMAYLKDVYIQEKTAEEIYEVWANLDEETRNHILELLKEADEDKYKELKKLIKAGELECLCGTNSETHQKGCPFYVAPVPPLPSFPSCNCGGGIYAGHDEDCSYADYMVNQYFGTVTTRDIYHQWESLDESAREGILGMMEAMDPNSLQELRAMLNGEANEVAAIVDSMTIAAVGAIPEGVTMAVESIDADAFGLGSALFAYDISFTDEFDEEWQPSGSIVKVTINAGELGIENGTYVKMYHIADDGSKENAGRYMVSGGMMTFEARSFSGYAGVADGAARSGTVTTTDAPIIINLFDYGSLVTQKSTRSGLAIGLGGAQVGCLDYPIGDDAPTVGTNTSDSYAGIGGGPLGTYPVLQNGYPARSKSGGGTISLDYLFNKSLPASSDLPYQQRLKTYGSAQYSDYDVLRYPVNTGNLFSETSDGYFEFDSRDNHAWYSPENGGTLHVENYAVNPDYTGDRRYSGIGHFLPFNGPIKNYDLTASTGDAYVMRNNGVWIDEKYQSKAYYTDTYTVNDSNFVNTKAANLYSIRRNSTNSAQNRVNMWIGMSVEFDFNQPQNGMKNGEDMVFEFSGDDLMWVYIDDVLVLDIANSGTHDRGVGGAKTATINFSTGEVIVYKVDSSIIDIQALDTNGNGFFEDSECNDTFKYHVAYHTTLRKLYEAAKNGGYINNIPEFKGETFADFETLSFKMFYMDTGHGTSNCSLKFNMDPLPAGSLSVKKVETELNEKFCSETEYAFELYKKTESATGFSKVTNATFRINGPGTPAVNDVSGADYTIGDDGIFKLKGNQTATFVTGITVKDTLYVKEIATGDLYTTTYSVNDSAAATGTQTNNIYISNLEQHEVVFTNQWNTEDLTIQKEMVGDVGDVSFSFTLTGPGDSNVFDLALENGDTVTIENLPVGYEFTLTEVDPSEGAFRYQTPEYNGTLVPFTSNFTYTIAEGTNSINVKNRCLTDLKIIKNLTVPAKEDQSFLFNVDELDVDVILTIKENQSTASVTVKDVIVGTYTVVEDERWSWRYEIDEAVDGNSASQTVTLSSIAANNQVEFTNKRTDPYWLSGDSYCENWWGGTNGAVVKRNAANQVVTE